MSYDIKLVDEHGDTVKLDAPHSFKGGTYELGGTNEAWLNVTYNYAPHFQRALDEKLGIRWLYGRKAADTIEPLKAAIVQLELDGARAVEDHWPPPPAERYLTRISGAAYLRASEGYWEPTATNARQALVGLLALAEMCPDATWTGD